MLHIKYTSKYNFQQLEGVTTDALNSLGNVKVYIVNVLSL